MPECLRMARIQDQLSDFDFVIVGAGASGCVLANLLSADPDIHVLLVEAGGPDDHPLIPVPGKWTSLLESAIDWSYTTEPQPGLSGRSIKWPRGKTYGGSSAMSAMAYVRGHPLCYDEWSVASGPIWSFRESLPLFNILEHNSRGASEFTGAGGPLVVADTTDPHAGHLAFLEAARDLGFAADPAWNFNGPRPELGAGFYQKNIQNGRRQSAAGAFLAPALARLNLAVWPHTQAIRVVFDGKKAEGLELSQENSRRAVRANRGVVLATGAIETPKLLMLSGVGPAAVLRRLGLPLVVDLPGVGANLHDHPRVALRWLAREPLAPSSVSAGLFTFSRRGPAPWSGEASTMWEGSAHPGSGAGAPPDLQFYVGRGLDQPEPFVTLTVALTRPRSRGSVTLRSADPATPPAIQPNYLAEPADLDALLDGVQLARDLAESRAFAAVRGAALDPDDRLRTAGELRAFIRRGLDTIFHPAGTCRMGNSVDAVVDGTLRVHGTEHLHVADASVMPAAVNSQTLAACLLIGARAARFVAG